MTKTIMMTAIDTVLDDLDQNYLRWLLENQTNTIYRLATLKNKMRKKPSVVGICYGICNCALVEALSPTWEHYSGNPSYPIPGNEKNQNPAISYHDNHLNRTKWIGQQKYYRFSLIDHLIKHAAYFYKEVEKRLKQL